MSKERVVCIDDNFRKTSFESGRPPFGDRPVKGEIYTVDRFIKGPTFNSYSLSELHPLDGWNTKRFRPVDDSFGEWVESTIMKEVELEEALIPK